jgi:hypothetical protein
MPSLEYRGSDMVPHPRCLDLVLAKSKVHAFDG